MHNGHGNAPKSIHGVTLPQILHSGLQRIFLTAGHPSQLFEVEASLATREMFRDVRQTWIHHGHNRQLTSVGFPLKPDRKHLTFIGGTITRILDRSTLPTQKVVC